MDWLNIEILESNNQYFSHDCNLFTFEFILCNIIICTAVYYTVVDMIFQCDDIFVKE